MRLLPQPGYVILKQYKLDTKTGAYEIPSDDDPDKAPEYGEVLEVGALLPDDKMPYDKKFVPKKGDKIAYKKYNHFKIPVGVKTYIAVHFENILLTIEDGNE